ncbi:MAG TPA: NnrU family protein [Steroidobacteraceae bacterium]|nr:NnrU family protein [Steroidobacteraceae bacterium]
MLLLVAGLLVFLGTHSLSIAAPGVRARLVGRMGEGPWKGLYSVVSLAAFVLLVAGFASARESSVILYHPPAAARYVALVLMVPVFPLLLAAYLPGRIRSTLKNPLLAATEAWAFSHLLANGSLADVLLFGSFLAWAVADRISLKRRAPRAIPMAPAGRFNDAIAVVAGLASYALFIAGLHQRLIGVAPLG